MSVHPTTSVEVTTKNTGSLTMGICAIVVGVMGLLIGWVPFLGLFAIPVAIVGIVLAVIGFILALVKGGKGIGLPLLGGFICVVAIVVPVLSTGGTSVAMTKAVDEVRKAAAVSPPVSEEVSVATPDSVPAAPAANSVVDEKSEYIRNNIRLYDVEVKYHATYSNTKVAGATFKLKNTGDRSLDRVEVTVYFKDSSGAIISEEDFNPVLVSSYSMGDNKPLKAGYVWQMEAEKFFAAKKVPKEWVEASFDARITDIKFSQ